MENQMQVFTSEQFGEVRTVEDNGKVMFCGSDVAKALGYNEPHKAVARHCKGGMKRPVLTNGGEQEMSFIPEGDVYRLIVSSKLPTAAKFESWVFDDVIPSIRKHGTYMTPAKLEEVMNDPDAWIKMLTTIKDERARAERLKTANINLLTQQVKDAPKVELAEAISEPDGSVLIRDFEKLLRSRGWQIKTNGLYKWMQIENLIYKTYRQVNGGWNYAASYGAVKNGLMYDRKAITGSVTTPVITPRGQEYILERSDATMNQQTKFIAPLPDITMVPDRLSSSGKEAMTIRDLQKRLLLLGYRRPYCGQNWLYSFLVEQNMIKAIGKKHGTKTNSNIYTATPPALANGWLIIKLNAKHYISSVIVTPVGAEYITELVKKEN